MVTGMPQQNEVTGPNLRCVKCSKALTITLSNVLVESAFLICEKHGVKKRVNNNIQEIFFIESGKGRL